MLSPHPPRGTTIPPADDDDEDEDEDDDDDDDDVDEYEVENACAASNVGCTLAATASCSGLAP